MVLNLKDCLYLTDSGPFGETNLENPKVQINLLYIFYFDHIKSIMIFREVYL